MREQLAGYVQKPIIFTASKKGATEEFYDPVEDWCLHYQKKSKQTADIGPQKDSSSIKSFLMMSVLVNHHVSKEMTMATVHYAPEIFKM